MCKLQSDHVVTFRVRGLEGKSECKNKRVEEREREKERDRDIVRSKPIHVIHITYNTHYTY